MEEPKLRHPLKKCIVIPDSYKGTLSSVEVCNTMKQKILEHFPDCSVLAVPIADGGEGTVDCFLTALRGAQKVTLTATGPFGDPTDCHYARSGNTAIIEMAQAAGLPLAEDRLDPRTATTYGVGEIILHAVRHGCTEIILGLGGSCTNDAGVGCARALGVEFYDKNGTIFAPTAATLSNIASFRLDKANRALKHCTITAMCDISNPMYGERGAACVFAPQKGADDACVKELDENLRALSATIERCLDINVSDIPGSGAAGAMGAGIIAFLGGSLQSGIDTVLDLIHFDEELSDTDLVFTGEGKIDAQSINGKVISGIAKRCKKANVPVIAVVGAIGKDGCDAYGIGVTSVFSINTCAEDYAVSRFHSRENLEITMDNIARLLRL